MKYSIVLCIVCLFASCNNITTVPQMRVPTNQIQLNLDNGVVHSIIIHEYVIDSCEYIGRLDLYDSQTNFLAHKGNCKNPVHQTQRAE